MLARHLLWACLPTFACAQGPEWTSFEDRINHAMAADPAGNLVLHGGRDVAASRLLGQTFTMTGGTWAERQPLQPSASPGKLAGHGLAGATTALGDSVVLFGGETSAGTTNHTWVWHGNSWSDRGALTGPTARAGHAMVYDSRSQRVILFGGQDSFGTQADTWSYEPISETWTRITTVNQPSPRRDHAMAFDPNANFPFGEVVLFGGTGFNSQTWTFDGTNWTLRPQASPPVGRRNAAMAFSVVGDHVVMFGGLLGGSVPNGDTWTFDRTTHTWTQQTPLAGPAARSQHAMARIPTTGGGGDVLLHGGKGSSNLPLPGTWIWDGFNWSPVAEPNPRNGSALAFDGNANSSSAILFGGETGTTLQNDTWSLTGLSWTQRIPANSPSPRKDASIAFDASRGRYVLFGGNNGADLADTWEWTGTTWSQRAPLLSPPASSGRPMARSAGQQALLFQRGNSSWRYDGTTWNESLQPAPPPARYYHKMVTNTSTREVILFGGGGLAGNLDDMWTFDGTSWHDITPLQRPAARFSHAMAYDAARGTILLHGGYGLASGDTWTYDGVSWTQRAGVNPGYRGHAAIAYDSSRQRVILFGGTPGGVGPYTGSNDTWEWDGSSWTLASPSNSPPPRYLASMAYDPTRNYTLLCAGISGSNNLSDTWLFDGTSWTNLPVTGGPSGGDFTAAFDSSTNRVVFTYDTVAFAFDGTNWTQFPATDGRTRSVSGLTPSPNGPGVILFGGTTNGLGSGSVNDTWHLQGTAWTQLALIPPDVTNYAIAYDPLRDRTVLFGGTSAGVRSQETWEWAGAAWIRIPIAGAIPAARTRASMTFDPERGVCVLFGGEVAPGVEIDDTWEYDGQSWTERFPTHTPGSSSGHSLGFDSARRLTVAFGPRGTWDYGPTAPAGAVVSQPIGCTFGPSPVLAIAPHQRPWLPGNFTVSVNALPSGALAFLVLGFTATSLPMTSVGSPQCTLGVNILSSRLMGPIGATSQSATYSFLSPGAPVPPAFVGVPLHVQALGLAGGSILASDAYRCVTGVR